MTPNSLYLLYCLESDLKVELPISEATEIKRLQLSGMLTSQLELTAVAKLLLSEADKIFQNKSHKMRDFDEEFKDKLMEYRGMFPTSKEAGKLVRNSISDLEQRMAWFMKTYPEYSWDNILSATRKYLESQNGDYKYCMTSAYFIKKDDKNKSSLSLLSSWCEAEVDDTTEELPPSVLGFNRLV